MLNFQKMSSSKNVRENPHQLRNKNLFPELNFHNNSKLFYFSHNHEMWREMIANCSITGSDENKRNENETLLLFPDLPQFPGPNVDCKSRNILFPKSFFIPDKRR